MSGPKGIDIHAQAHERERQRCLAREAVARATLERHVAAFGDLRAEARAAGLEPVETVDDPVAIARRAASCFAAGDFEAGAHLAEAAVRRAADACEALTGALREHLSSSLMARLLEHGGAAAPRADAAAVVDHTPAGTVDGAAAPRVGLTAGGNIAERLAALVAAVAVHRDTAAYERVLRQAEQVSAERDPERQRRAFGALATDCAAIEHERRRVAAWREALDRLEDATADLRAGGAPELDEPLREVAALRRAGRVVPLDDVRTRLQAAADAARRRHERERTRTALLEALGAIGYVPREGMATALVTDGRLLLQRPTGGPYAVELRATPTLGRVQTRLVRIATSPTTSLQQARQDVAEEEAWCADHARILDQLRARGLDARFVVQRPAGAHPVAVVAPTEVAGDALTPSYADDVAQHERAGLP